MITDEELLKKIEELSGTYNGQLDDFYQAVGMIVVGRYFGWRVMRLVSSRKCWMTASKLFGDPKNLMKDREKYATRSKGLAFIDSVGGYWDFIKGNREAMPLEQRKMVVDKKQPQC